MTTNAFQTHWLERFGLSKTGWENDLDGLLTQRPFCDSKEAKKLIRFLFGKLPDILDKKPSPDTLMLAEAFAWCCFAIWQCGSAFPSFPENYAACLHDALRQPAKKRGATATILARLIVPAGDGGKGRCGFNQLTLAKPELIRESERLIHEGRYEDYLNAKEKYEEYEGYLGRSNEFQSDWERIKDTFPEQVAGRQMIHRTLIPERNWERGPGAEFGDTTRSFLAVFDLFCWKYYLWAMEGDRPHLLKASVVFTPLGTQIFIPGYLSFDPKRDLDFGKIAKLHRARGISRQGKGFSESRKETAKNKVLAKEADADARKMGLKGDKRYAFISQRLGMLDQGDYRQVKRLLE